MEGSWGDLGALRLFGKEVKIEVKLDLVEVDFVFVTTPQGRAHGNRVTVQAGLLRKKLYLSFSIGGPADGRDTLPAALVDAIKAALRYAEKNVRAKDLVEQYPELDEHEECEGGT